jgi:hypothetical protein
MTDEHPAAVMDDFSVEPERIALRILDQVLGLVKSEDKEKTVSVLDYREWHLSGLVGQALSYFASFAVAQVP